jgi:hypothetical protein
MIKKILLIVALSFHAFSHDNRLDALERGIEAPLNHDLPDFAYNHKLTRRTMCRLATAGACLILASAIESEDPSLAKVNKVAAIGNIVALVIDNCTIPPKITHHFFAIATWGYAMIDLGFSYAPWDFIHNTNLLVTSILTTGIPVITESFTQKVPNRPRLEA